MLEGIQHSENAVTPTVKKPEQSPLDEGLPLEKTIELSREGGEYADAMEVARLLGNTSPEFVAGLHEYQKNQGNGFNN